MIKLFNVEEAYINYLRSFEPKVLENKNEHPLVRVSSTLLPGREAAPPFAITSIYNCSKAANAGYNRFDRRA